LSPAKNNLPNVVSTLEQEGIKDKIVIMIGGTAVTKEDADKIGAQYGKTKDDAVAIAKNVMNKKQNIININFGFEVKI
jgi:methanogenic corrinoid protein MtbC1